MMQPGSMFCRSGAVIRHLAILGLLAAVLFPVVHAQDAPLVDSGTTNGRPASAVENLTGIQQSIDIKRSVILELRSKLKNVEDKTEREELEQKINRARSEVNNLEQSFEQILLGGLNLSILTDVPEKRINWQDEIEQISKPLLSTLKKLTEKPRQIDALRRDIERRQGQLKIVAKAIDTIDAYNAQDLPPAAANAIKQLLVDWQQRRDEIQRAEELARYRLDSLSAEDTGWEVSTGEALTNFLYGRGLTLLLAISTALVIGLLVKGLIGLYRRWLSAKRQDKGEPLAPLFLYSYRLLLTVIIVFSILMVFYIRGDVLLITLSVVVLIGVVLSLRQTLPRYTAELRLLLGVGPVREGERCVLDGIPYLVESLSVYTQLRNPELEGVVRLPLHTMNDHVSRPLTEEPWFPCRPDEYVILGNGNLARVLTQTIERVEVMVIDSIVQIRTQDFLEQNVRNLTRDGFGIAATFGIDYQHQAICLDIVPARLRAGIIARFEKAGMKEDIKDLMIEFNSAGASSLDYRIYMILNGRAAKAYYKAQRMVQQACVDTCNLEGWVIPFTQVTVHSAALDNAAQTISDGHSKARDQAPESMP